MTESGHEQKKICSCNSLEVFDWLADFKDMAVSHDIIEIRFKNTRKGFFLNGNQLVLKQGDIVAVESSPGHDIGVVSLRGELVLEQMKKYNVSPDSANLRKIYRKAKPADLEKWKESILLEMPTMLKAREITESMKLNMKISDVEYQGDNTKAIFYYIAEERVDFRELIKVLAEEFRIRIEMKQVGARQEAGRIGGIGVCGRQLCCSSWLVNFKSVTTNAARIQDISLNPQKLAGQCSKLKCCINYEVVTYSDAKRGFPELNKVLETNEGKYYFQKAEIFKKLIWYSDNPDSNFKMVPLTIQRVKEVITLNKEGRKPDKLLEDNNNNYPEVTKENDFLINESITRFDNAVESRGRKKKKKRKKNSKFKGQNNGKQKL